MIFYKAGIIKRGKVKRGVCEDMFLARVRRGHTSFSFYRGYLKRGCWRLFENSSTMTRIKRNL